MKLIASISILFFSFRTLDCLNSHSHGRKLNNRLNFFDIELLRATVEKKGNVIVSPASVKSTLAMLLAGANGLTAREIEESLRVSHNDNSIEQLDLYFRALQANTSTAVLQSANGIFISDKLKLNPKYEAIIKLHYLSQVTQLDFNNANAAAVGINNWVSENTHGLIPFVVEPVQLKPQTDLVVANALYFKSTWHTAFDSRQTTSRCFYRDGECKMVAMMEMETELNYAHIEDLKAHAVELPYEGKRYSMIVIVPHEKDGMEGLIRDLPYVSLPRIMDLMHPADVMLSLPRFTVNYNENLVEALGKMHITSLFTNNSNLSKIFENTSSYVNGFHHKVFMSVDETGTVAAASSSAMVVPLIFTGVVQVVADRPFMFFIRDNELGVVLFEGKIEEPSVLEQTPLAVPTGKFVTNPAIVFIENRMPVPTVQSNSTPKPKSFVDSIKKFFG